MALLERDRVVLEEKRAHEEVKRLEEEVAIGKSAERLLNDPNWKRIADGWQKAIEEDEKVLMNVVLNLVKKSDTSMEEDHIVCNKIRSYYQDIYNRRQLLDQPQEEMKLGLEAQERLDKLKEERDNG